MSTPHRDLRALSERVEQMREEERARIARELHDELGQLLTGIKLDFSSTIRKLREIRPQGEGFVFAGEFYCPWGDCTQPLHGVFKAIGNGALRGTFRDATMSVLLEPAPDAAFGGATYGGDGYGGFGYGGATYGQPLKQQSNRQP